MVSELPDNVVLSELTDNGNAESILATIVNKHAGKVIYLDFWATWCSPCIAKMPASKKLHDMFRDKDVAFVYLASSNSPENVWKSMISELDLAGDHYFA